MKTDLLSILRNKQKKGTLNIDYRHNENKRQIFGNSFLTWAMVLNKLMCLAITNGVIKRNSVESGLIEICT